jgi:menaquinone-dependent protoporphyrinogen IX oxidase
MRREALERRPSAVGSVNVAARCGQERLDELPYVRLIVNDENAGYAKRMLP